MLKQKYLIFLLLFLLISSLIGCSSVKESVKGQNSAVSIEKNFEKEVQTPEISETKNVEHEASGKETSNVSTQNGNESSKNVTIEYKKKQSKSIIETIKKLEQYYDTEAFEKWQSLLTSAYKEKYSDPEFLKAQGWEAKDLKSFFYLLIKTRKKNGIKSLAISRVEFVDSNKAYVYVLLKGKEFPKPQHTFIKVGNSWYKGLPDEEK